jgi:4-hydroxy-tetrahydrodipicolinate reductase
VHHFHKKDAPSGTALTLAEHVKNSGWPGEVAIESERRGEVVGLHSLRWDSDHDVVALHHEAKSRVGFAEGAIWALKWTWKQHKLERFGLFTMNNLFDT